jgi:LacI family transcriptional regulator
MATIYEVAAKAGVSPATVSRVFNGLPVSTEKIELVRAASDELRYSPNKTARRLRNQTSEVVALLIPDIENPFFTALARGVEDALQAAGYSVVLCNTDDNPEKETRYLDIANSENMAGVILAPSSEDGDIRHLTDRGRPVVAVDRNTGLNIDSVMVDNRAAGAAATTALYEAGYQRIACIAGPVEIESTEERTMGWRQVVRRRGGDSPIDAYLQHANYRVDGGRSAMQALLALEARPDAVVTTNNLMGVGAIQVLSEAGIIPPEIGVAVIGDLPFATLSPRAITQVHLPARHLGTTAANMLLERIAGDKQPARTVVLRAEVTQGLTPFATS